MRQLISAVIALLAIALLAIALERGASQQQTVTTTCSSDYTTCSTSY